MNTAYNGPYTLYDPPAQVRVTGASPKVDTKQSARPGSRGLSRKSDMI